MKFRLHLRLPFSTDKSESQRGYVLIAVLFAVTLMLVAVAAIAPSYGTQIKREREQELIHRGNQYARAIRLYYRKFGRFPASVEQLENTNNVRFLRRKYADPITGKDEWKLIRFGQARPKPLPAYLTGGKSGTGSSPGIGAGQTSGIGAGQTSGFGAGPSGGLGAGPTGGLGAGPSGGFGGGPTGGQSGQGAQGSPGGVNASDISKPLSGSPTLGGGPIVGVASTSEKATLKELDGRKKYNEWEFTYDPSLDQAARQQPGNVNPNGLQRDPRGERPGGPTVPQPMPGPTQPQ